VDLSPDWHESREPGPDFVSADGRSVLELKQRAQAGLRDLNASWLQLAAYLARHPKLRRGILAVVAPGITIPRLQQAWSEAQSALREDVAKRMVLIVLGDKSHWLSSNDAQTERLAATLSRRIITTHNEGSATRRRGRTSSAFFDVFKVLLASWLRNEGPIQIQELRRRSGCSHPTVLAALDELDRREEVERSSDRRAELRGMPRKTIEEVVILSSSLRESTWIVDVSGRSGDPSHLQKRLQRAKPTNVGLGGVVAARHYHGRLDLNGLPRLDITVWAQRGDRYDPTFLTEVDPGLRLIPQLDNSAIAVVHRLSRAEALFEPGDVPGLPFADPAEVLLDLYELKLDPQARSFAQHLRGGKA
jgi:hypothetical protein